MNKEIITAALLILLLAFAALNIAMLDCVFSDIIHCLALSGQAASENNFDRAIAHFEKALNKWHSHQAYFDIFLRQPELDSIEDTFYDLAGALADKNNSSAILSALLQNKLSNLLETEKPAVSSIF